MGQPLETGRARLAVPWRTETFACCPSDITNRSSTASSPVDCQSIAPKKRIANNESLNNEFEDSDHSIWIFCDLSHTLFLSSHTDYPYYMECDENVTHRILILLFSVDKYSKYSFVCIYFEFLWLLTLLSCVASGRRSGVKLRHIFRSSRNSAGTDSKILLGSDFSWKICDS